MSDPINWPPHYNASAIQPIDVIEAWRLGFHLGAVVQYICRADHKGSRLEDLKKARWYLDREIERSEKANPHVDGCWFVMGVGQCNCAELKGDCPE